VVSTQSTWGFYLNKESTVFASEISVTIISATK